MAHTVTLEDRVMTIQTLSKWEVIKVMSLEIGTQLLSFSLSTYVLYQLYYYYYYKHFCLLFFTIKKINTIMFNIYKNLKFTYVIYLKNK